MPKKTITAINKKGNTVNISLKEFHKAKHRLSKTGRMKLSRHHSSKKPVSHFNIDGLFLASLPKKEGGVLGKGAFAKVKIAVNQQGQRFALKIAKKNLVKRNKAVLKNEGEIGLDLGLIKASTVRQHDSGITQQYHVMPYLGKELFDYLSDNENILTNYQRLDIAMQLCFLVHQLHSGNASKSSRPIAHRDIKPENAIIDKNNNVKLIDIGLASYAIDSKPLERIGTPYFVPVYSMISRKEDVFALRRTLYEPQKYYQYNLKLYHRDSYFVLSDTLIDIKSLLDFVDTTPQYNNGRLTSWDNSEAYFPPLYLAAIMAIANLPLTKKQLTSTYQSIKDNKTLQAAVVVLAYANEFNAARFEKLKKEIRYQKQLAYFSPIIDKLDRRLLKKAIYSNRHTTLSPLLESLAKLPSDVRFDHIAVINFLFVLDTSSNTLIASWQSPIKMQALLYLHRQFLLTKKTFLLIQDNALCEQIACGLSKEKINLALNLKALGCTNTHVAKALSHLSVAVDMIINEKQFKHREKQMAILSRYLKREYHAPRLLTLAMTEKPVESLMPAIRNPYQNKQQLVRKLAILFAIAPDLKKDVALLKIINQKMPIYFANLYTQNDILIALKTYIKCIHQSKAKHQYTQLEKILLKAKTVDDALANLNKGKLMTHHSAQFFKPSKELYPVEVRTLFSQHTNTTYRPITV